MSDQSAALRKMDSIKPRTLIDHAKEKGELFKDIKTHQLRNFYKEITAMKQEVDSVEEGETMNEDELRLRLMLLKPKLAYAAGRGGRSGKIQSFYEFIDLVIDGVDQAEGEQFPKALNNFFHLMESIVAFHKFYGGD